MYTMYIIYVYNIRLVNTNRKTQQEKGYYVSKWKWIALKDWKLVCLCHADVIFENT